MTLQRIVYASRNRIQGTDEEIIASVDQILHTARRNNAAIGVTGALIFNSGGFAQVLEGRSSDLETVFERIQCDPRHSDVLVLDYAPISQRNFPDWSMGFIGASRKSEHMFGAISQSSGFDPARIKADDILNAMHDLVLEEEHV